MRNMMIVIALLFLGACASAPTLSVPNPISYSELAAAESTYGLALAGAVGYRKACADKAIPRSCRAIVGMMQSADKKAQVALNAARPLVKQNSFNAVTAVNAAKSAISAFKSIVDRNAV